MLRLMLMLAALVAPPPPTAQVHVASPRPYEVWDGRVRGHVPAGTAVITVTARGRSWQVPVAADGSFDRLLRRVPVGDVRVSLAGRTVAPRLRRAQRVDPAAGAAARRPPP